MYVAGYGYFSCKGTVGVVSEKSRGCEEVAESGEVYVEIAGIVMVTLPMNLRISSPTFIPLP